MFKGAGARGGSGDAHPDQKMSRRKGSPAMGFVYVGGKLKSIGAVSKTLFPTTTERQAMQRKSNAKRRRRDKQINDE